MIEITVSVQDKDYPFFMELVNKFDFVTIKRSTNKKKTEKSIPINTKEVQEGTNASFSSPALEGPPLSEKEFKDWIELAESAPAIDLQQAKNKWAKKRKILEQLIP